MLIYNTLSKKKEEFIPLIEGRVKMYVCGPTVYNYFHLGNARPFLFFDVVRNYFIELGYEVLYIQNITDIDDKIINRANEAGLDYFQITAQFTQSFFEDLQSLSIHPADAYPKATDFILEMITLITDMISQGFAYEVNGDVYFSVAKLPQYGQLSSKDIANLHAGARIEANHQKQNAFDFTLWKKAKDHEPSWESPWGKGRPGWHTECVVMSHKYLGQTFDIHGGGIDLVFPHHENELAQALAVNNQPLANYWMHNGFLHVDGTKMSKSKHNFFTARDVLQKYNADTIRFFFLSKHYRSPIEYSVALLDESKTAIQRFYEVFRKFPPPYPSPFDCVSLCEINRSFHSAMQDDFNTAQAIVYLFELAKRAFNNNNEAPAAASLLYKLGKVLGFFGHLESINTPTLDSVTENYILYQIERRKQAKKDKNFVLADQIREELNRQGVELRDTVVGTEFRIKD